MTKDEKATLRWLLEGHGNERIRIDYSTPEGPMTGYGSIMEPGRAAAIRVLKASAPLHPAIRSAFTEAGIPFDMEQSAIALALEPVSVSKWRISAEVKKLNPGRPRKNGGGAFKLKLTVVSREGRRRPKKDAVTEASDRDPLSDATFYRRRKKGLAARAAGQGWGIRVRRPESG